MKAYIFKPFFTKVRIKLNPDLVCANPNQSLVVRFYSSPLILASDEHRTSTVCVVMMDYTKLMALFY